MVDEYTMSGSRVTLKMAGMESSASTMSAPYGLALSGVNGLLVSDVQLNRVLYFPMANGDLTSPQG